MPTSTDTSLVLTFIPVPAPTVNSLLADRLPPLLDVKPFPAVNTILERSKEGW